MSLIEGAPDGKSLIDGLPRTAVQALYHAVTGKTENLSKWLNGNVLISFSSIKSLYNMLCEQIQHYDLLAEQTVTIVTTDEEDRKVGYSSWARFEKLQAESQKITSDVSIKIEFVAKLPNTETPQRCIINVTLDSALPVIFNNRKEESFEPPLGFLIFMSSSWRSVNVSIDFVDYLLAKNFLSIVEEWFKSLPKIKSSKINIAILKNSRTITSISSQMGRTGAALFLIGYYSFSNGAFDPKTLIAVSSISLFIWSLVSVMINFVNRKIRKRAMQGVVPTAIILCNRDQQAFDEIANDSRLAGKTAAIFVGSNVTALAVNILASYIFSYLHG